MDMLKKEISEKNVIDSNKKNAPSKKKFLKVMVLVFVIVGIVAAGFFAWPKVMLKFNQPKEQPTDLIGQYKQDLENLKEQADKSGSAADLQNYGIAQYATGDQSGAEQTYLKQLEKEPNSIIAHSGLANALRDQKKFDQAIEQYKKVIELSPTNISVYANLASVYQYQLKQVDKAIEVYQGGIEKNVKSTDLYLLMGLAYEQIGDKDNAKKTYEKVLEINENNAAAKAALERLAQ